MSFFYFPVCFFSGKDKNECGLGAPGSVHHFVLLRTKATREVSPSSWGPKVLIHKGVGRCVAKSCWFCV